MTRKAQPTAEKAKQLRWLLKDLGLEDWIKNLPPHLSKRKRGRAKLADEPMFKGLELFLRVAESEWGMSREAALHWMFDYNYQNGAAAMVPRFGFSADAVVARLKRKLREGSYHKWDIRELAPPEWLERGVDGTVSFRPRCPPRSRVMFAALCALSAFPLTETDDD